MSRKKINPSFIGAKLCHQQICLASVIKTEAQFVICCNPRRTPALTFFTIQQLNFLTTESVQLAFPIFALRFFYA